MQNKLCVLAVLAIVGFVGSPRAANAQAVYKVGTFTKCSSAGGASCPNGVNVNLVPHGLGVQPKAVIIWTSGSLTGTGSSLHYLWGFGATDGAAITATTGSRSVATSSASGYGASQVNRRAASKAITIIQYDTAAGGTAHVLKAEADLGGGNCTAAWDATNFCLNWTTNSTDLFIIHYLAIGGADVSAKMVDWTAVAAGAGACPGGAGCKSVTVGWTPTVVLNFMDYDTTLGAAGSCVTPNCATNAAFMLGAMTAANTQWASAIYNVNGNTNPAPARYQRTDSAILQTSSSTTPAETLRAHLVSMNDGSGTGFTVQFDTNTGSLATHIFSLALSGVNFWAGSFNRTTSGTCASCGLTQLQSVPMTGAGFTPKAVLLAGDTGAASNSPQTHGFFTFGAGDAPTSRAMSEILDIQGANSGANKYDYTAAKIFGMETTALAIVAQADLNSLDASGFTLRWDPVNVAGTEQILYLALGQLPAGPTAVKLTSFIATPVPGGGIRLAWRTGYEVDNVGFRLYREQNGRRVPITSSIVPGTALIGAGRGASNGAREYTFSDIVLPSEASPVQYWLEDVDIKGKSTWHGPFAPATATTTREH
jgi:hypothetical protein